MSDRLEEKLSDLLAEAAPETEPASGWEARVMQSVTAARPMRRRRWIAVTVGAAVALLGLGFLPIPTPGGKGALGRALAAVEASSTFHMITYTSYNGDTSRDEEWWSSDGFHRTSGYVQDGRYQYTEIDTPESSMYYGRQVRATGTTQSGSVTDHTPLAHLDRPHFPAERSQTNGLFTLVDTKGLTVREQRDFTVWGGTIDVVTAEGIAPSMSGIAPASHVPQDRIKYRAEFDGETGRLLQAQEWVQDEEGEWQRTYWTETVEWNLPIPDEVRHFTFPAGTKVREDHWWRGRPEQVLAEGETADWIVKLHEIDRDRQGRLYLTLSRTLKTGSPLLGTRIGGRIDVEVTDGSGLVYRGDTSALGNAGAPTKLRWDGSSTVGCLTFQIPPPRKVQTLAFPTTATVVLHHFPKDGVDQLIRFDHVPVPPAANSDDLFEDATEYKKY
jgi:hypothetical protein